MEQFRGFVEAKIKTIDKEIDEIKEEVKGIKEDQKQDRQFYVDTIASLKENLVRITVLTEKQDERMNQQDNKIDGHYSSMKQELTGLRQDMKDTYNSHTKWYQDFLSGNFGMILKVLFIIILAMLGAKIGGIDIGSFMK